MEKADNVANQKKSRAPAREKNYTIHGAKDIIYQG
jgi:hypothetical protein